MTTLYKPVLIESAEQAEALPVGTVATYRGVCCGFEVAIRDEDGEWWDAPGGINQKGPAYTDQTITGWTALVPVEAEEERVQRIQYDRRGYESDVHSETRLVTPWERIDGPSPDRRGDCA